MTDYLDPDHWVNGGDCDNSLPEAKAFAEVIKERDEARAEVEQLKQALHDARLENSGQAALLERKRQEPSRLEIAAMLKAGWFANRDADFNATDHKWWIEQADALIRAAKEEK
jgi:hypothetical protein